MAITYGSKNLSKSYYGSKKVKKIYSGSKLIFPLYNTPWICFGVSYSSSSLEEVYNTMS